MERSPKISIIIPIYNVESYLSRCLTSVVRQTLRDIEIICVNDGTKDASVDIVREYMKRDHRIRLIEKENGGISSARNVGLEQARGTQVLFLDSDDYLTNNACERIYEEYGGYNADITIFGSTPFPEIPEPEEWIPWKLDCEAAFYQEFVPAALFEERSAMPFVWNHAYSRKFLMEKEIRFEEGVHLGEDMIFIQQSMPMAYGIRFMDDKLHYYRCSRPNSAMDYYDADKGKKLRCHVENQRIVSEYWREHGFLEKWGKEYLEWTVDFIVSDLIQYHPANQKELARQFLRDLEEFGVLNYKKHVRFETHEKIKRLKKMAR